MAAVVAVQCLVSRSNHDRVADPSSEAAVVGNATPGAGQAAVRNLNLKIHSLAAAPKEAHTFVWG
jgi:hypothetical protein